MEYDGCDVVVPSCAPVVKQSGRWVYIPDPEEIPVTFQIGMVGSDGVLLASDTCCLDLRQPDGSIWTTSDTPKIEIDADNRLAYCWSGDEMGRIVVGAISAMMTTESRNDFRSFLPRVFTEAIARASKIKQAEPGRPFKSCDVLLAADHTISESVTLWYARLLLSEAGCLLDYRAEPITTKKIIGDAANPAAFFSERYFRKSITLPIQDLVPLASHVILTAGELNSFVNGLQVVLCRPDGFRDLGDEEIQGLVERSRKLDSDIATSLGIPTF